MSALPWTLSVTLWVSTKVPALGLKRTASEFDWAGGEDSSPTEHRTRRSTAWRARAVHDSVALDIRAIQVPGDCRAQVRKRPVNRGAATGSSCLRGSPVGVSCILLGGRQARWRRRSSTGESPDTKRTAMRTWRVYSLAGVVAAGLAAFGAHLVAQQKSATPALTDADWPRYAGDFAGTKHSKLTQINASNVATLVPAWTFQGVGTQQTPIAVNGVMYASTSTGAVALDGATGAIVWRYGAAPAPSAARGAGAGRAGGARDGGAGRGAEPAAEAAAAAGEGQAGAAAPPPARGAGPGAGAAAGRGGGAAGRGRGAPPPPPTAAGAGSAPSSRGVAYWPGDGTLPPRILMFVGERLVALNALTGAL